MNRKRLNVLIKRSIAGEAAALEQLCQLYAKTILFQTRLLVRNKDDAEDVAQRVAIEMLGGIRSLRSPYAFRNWLQRLIVNACNKQNARTKREAEREENLDGVVETIIDENPESLPEAHFDSAALRQDVGGYLDRLPPSQAVALTLYYYEQLSYKEVADTMGISAGTVASTISKAKKNLKEMLKERNNPGAFGIIALPPFFRGGPGETVRSEVESSVSSGAIERFMGVCKTNIAAIATSAGTAVAATGSWGTVVATIVGFALLGGIGVGAYILISTPEPEVVPIEEVIPEVTTPDSRVTYSVAGQQLYDDPVNPLTAQFDLLSGESIEGWILTDSSGTELARGGGYADTGTITAPDEATAKAIAEGRFIDITALGLANGDYTINWYLINQQGGKSHVYWDFTITSSP